MIRSHERSTEHEGHAEDNADTCVGMEPTQTIPNGAALLEKACAVARRQAFGPMFDPFKRDRALADQIVSGEVALRPHKTVRIQFPIDWEQDPLRQRNWRWQFHMLRWLDPLRRMAAAGDTSYMPFWEAVAKDWVSHNSSRTEKGQAPWADMVDAMRAHALLLALPYVNDPEWLIESLVMHGEWLQDERNHGRGNHAMHQHASLFMLGCALGHDAWKASALSRIRKAAANEFDEQGVSVEAAPGYWYLNYNWWRQLARRISLEGEEGDFISERLTGTPIFLAHATTPLGTLEVIGDTGPNVIPTDSTSPELEYVTSGGLSGRPPEQASIMLRSGFVFGRSGWGDGRRALDNHSFYSLRFGRADAIHGHRDGGNLTVWASGKPIVVDAGQYGYRSDDLRRYVLGRSAHNVPHVRGSRYEADSEVAVIDYELCPEYDYVHLRDAGYPGVTIDRQVVFVRITESWLVVDRFRSAQDIVGESLWHIDPDARVARSGSTVEVRQGDLVANFTRGSSHAVELGEGWHSRSYGNAERSPLIKTVRKGSRFRMATHISHGLDRAALPDHLSIHSSDMGITTWQLFGRGRRVWVSLSDTQLVGVSDAAPIETLATGSRERTEQEDA